MAADTELQVWWTEICTKGHPDADPMGWPVSCKNGNETVVDSKKGIRMVKALADITTTMAWMGSAHHAAGTMSSLPVWRWSPSLCSPHPCHGNSPVGVTTVFALDL